MDFKNIKKLLSTSIKVISIVLMTGAIALESWNLYAQLTNGSLPLPANLTPVFWIERIAIAAHLVEAVIAAVVAPSRQQAPLKYGTYTFFVGTVGLWELFEQKKAS